MDPTIRASYNPTYRSWYAMRKRCLDENNEDYGGRGITFHPDWEDYFCFLEDMGVRPEGHTLDRINGDLGYSKNNCRWLTPRGQCNNRRSTRRLTFQGETMSVTEWARRLEMNDQTLFGRLRWGWSVERTLTTPRIKAFTGNQWSPHVS